MIRVPASTLRAFCYEVLLSRQVRADVASHVADGLVQASVRGVDSHGVRLLPHYLAGVAGGRINPQPTYRFERTASATGLLDADHTFGHAAGIEAARHAVALAEDAGTGQVAVYNSTHFGAAAYFALEMAKHDMIGLSFTNTDALVKTHGGTRPFLGNNPLCFAAPCEGEEPFCLDMATSVVTFNHVRQWREQGLAAPAGAGADHEGVETTNPQAIHSLLPIGGYKGYGLSLAIEILCGLLTGMPYGPHIPKMFEAPMSERRRLGHCVMAIRISAFQPVDAFKQRMAMLLNALRAEPRCDPRVPVQVAGDPEKRAAKEREALGIPLSAQTLDALTQEGAACGIALSGAAASAPFLSERS